MSPLSKNLEARKRQLANLQTGRKPSFYTKRRKFGSFEQYENDIVKFIEEQIYLENNRLILLEEWEREIFRDCFYEKRPRLILISLAKKNGKSTFSAIILLWFLMCQERGELYICSNSKDQSNFITFRKCVDMLRKNKELSNFCKVYKDYIVNLKSGSILRCLSSSFRSSAGLSPLMLSLDEINSFDTDSLKFFYEELQLAPGYGYPLILITSTVGRQEQGILWDLFEIAKKGNTPDSYFYIKQGEESNPSSFVTDKYLDKQKNKPGMRKNVFKRLHKNLWTQEEEDFIIDEDYRNCVDYSLEKRSEQRLPVFLGLDVGYRNDFTAVVAVNRSLDRIILVDHKVFRPSPETKTLDFSEVKRYFLELNERYFIESCFFDPFQAIQLSQDLRKEKIKMIELAQTQANCILFSQCLFDLIKGRNISFYPSEEMRESLLNCKAVYSSRGWRIIKKRRKGKIDLAIALGMAVYGASISEQRSLRVGRVYTRRAGFSSVAQETVESGAKIFYAGELKNPKKGEKEKKKDKLKLKILNERSERKKGRAFFRG